MQSLFNIFIFPGFLFLFVFGLSAQFFDRRIYARLQNRQGPPWFQPLADFIKLVSKEEIIPEEANPNMFKAMPVIALTAVVTTIMYVPMWKPQALCYFNGDLVVVLYLLTFPTLTMSYLLRLGICFRWKNIKRIIGIVLIISKNVLPTPRFIRAWDVRTIAFFAVLMRFLENLAYAIEVLSLWLRKLPCCQKHMV